MLLVRALSLCILFCGVASASPFDAAVDAATQKLRADPAYKGLLVGVLRGADQALIPYGKTDDKHGAQPIGADTVFGIGSVTKTFPALLLALMTVKKMVHVKTSAADTQPDETVQHLMHELGLSAKYPLPYPRNGMTLADLADHHSGLPKKYPNLHTIDDAYRLLTTCPIVASKADMNADSLCGLVYACSSDSHCYCDCSMPGVYLYSNFAFQVLAHLLSARWSPGKSWATINNELVEKYFQMKHTHVQSDLTSWEKDRLAVKPTKDPLFSTGDEGNASGNLFSTGNDMLKWLAYNAGMGRCIEADCSELAVIRYARNNECAPRTTCDKQIGLAWTIEPIEVPGPSPGPKVGYAMYSKGGDAPNYHAFIGYALSPLRPTRGVFILKNWDDSKSTPSLKDVGRKILETLPW